ncbi:MAG: nicotinamidase-related amidase [Pirellulaceae bacterium]|jgi:nicotinamidase-related amidase
MTTTDSIVRSPELMSSDTSAILVVDVQDKLLAAIPNHKMIVWNISRLLRGAKTLGVLTTATEQYPEKLGGTTAELAGFIETIPPKLKFSCGACPEIFHKFRDGGIDSILVAGIETHVCVLQTVYDLLSEGFRVQIPVDASGSRFDVDRDTAIRRMESSGVVLTTTETALFEWCEVAGTPEFKSISQIVRESAPDG